MASIKINSRTVVEACDKSKEKINLIRSDLREELGEGRINDIIGLDKCFDYARTDIIEINKIKIMAEHSIGQLIYIDHNDFQLIGEYLK